MNLEIKTLFQSLNKAYIALGLFIDYAEWFKTNYITFFDTIKPEDSEETIKDAINKLLTNVFYNENFLIKENFNDIDLAIYNGKVVNERIGVIIETKSLQNSNEMISQSEINKKSFHQLLQYYLEERIIHKNSQIKHLIITNSIDWFIFDSSEFEKMFYQDKNFHKNYVDWYGGKLISKHKDWFYNEIAKPFIENSQEKIVCTYFQLSKNFIDTEKNLIELYKILSPEHLLKLPFQNDSNYLNLEFYNELLHLMGLYETDDNIAKIERLPQKRRNKGSLLENIIAVLEKNEEMLSHITDLQEFGDTNEEQLFSISLELCITWVNRILFLKLLESQIVRFNDDEKDFAFLHSQKIGDFEDLRELFFDVLAIEPEERTEMLQIKYKAIPYLNSSLFEQSLLEKECVKINQLNSHLEIPIFSATVLKNSNGKRQTGNLPTLEYIFEFLNSYNFASDHKSAIQKENKTLINSAVLGLIFEKINGYKEGSFFTPGQISMYICRETIRKAVLQKFNSKYSLHCENIEQLYNQLIKIDIFEANKTFNSIKICDPAVGSGHFLVSTLNELIAMKSELGILCDAKGKMFRNTYCEVQNDELFISHFGEIFVYKYKDKECQRIQETIFNEKQILIENCLFGVDINPKSVHICRLRLWIELLKNAFYTQKSNFKALETLPNIDINIKCGNSLVSRYALNGKNGKFSNGVLQKIKKITEEYKIQVSLYKNVLDRAAKREINKNISKLKSDFESFINPTDKDYLELKKKRAERNQVFIAFSLEEKLEIEKKVAQLEIDIENLEAICQHKRVTLYLRAFEWRFAFPEVLDDEGSFEGFDAVVGNPPYGVKLKSFTLDYLKLHYKSTETIPKVQKGSTNTFALFIERGFNLVKKDGFVHFIVPISFTCSDSMAALHNLLENNCEYIKVSSYAVRPLPIFDKAVVNTSMVEVKKTFTKCEHIYSTKMYRKSKGVNFNKLLRRLEFVDVIKYKQRTRIPKISLPIEVSILEKLLATETKISDLVTSKGANIYYRAAGGRYFKVITNYSTGSSTEKFLIFNENIANSIGAILSSNLFFWYYQVFSDNLSIKLSDLLNFPIPKNKLTSKIISNLEKIYQEYLIDIEKNAITHQTKKYAHITSFKEYKIVLSKLLIDKIDDVIGVCYGFSEAEIEFIKNYELKFRLQLEEEKKEDDDDDSI